jgi:hypothetical protein
MSLRDDNAKFALLKAVVDAATAEIARLRADHTGHLVERFKEEGTTSFKALLPDGTAVATISLTIPKPTLTVTDDEAFKAWLETNHPNAIDTETIPAQPEQLIPAVPERVERNVNPKRITSLMEQFKPVPDGVVDLTTGMLVAGVEMTPAADPKQFSVTYAKDGRDQLADAYRAGDLDALVAGSALPALGRGSA